MLDDKALIAGALEAAANSHAPYSGRPSGASLMADDGSLYAGAVVEVRPLCGTATPVAAALGSAISAGRRSFVRIAVMPCRNLFGDELQLLAEFGADIEVITQREDGTILRAKVAELLPHSF